MENILDLLHVAERLKFELRHSWLSNGRQESVAEHSWRMSLMAVLLAPHMTTKLQMDKVLTMVIIHDLPEAKVGDMPNFGDLGAAVMHQKFQSEQQAMAELGQGIRQGKELYDLWMEYETGDSPEALFVRALDKLEVFVQHVEAGAHTWNEKEKILFADSSWIATYCTHDLKLMEFADALCARAASLSRAELHESAA